MKKVFVGIDMGATHIRICVMDEHHQILSTDKRKTLEVLKNQPLYGLTTFCKEFTTDFIIQRIVIGLPAAVSLDRKEILSVPNLSLSKQELDGFVPMLEQYFHCDVQLERDVNLQLIYDVNDYQRNNKLVIGVYLGTGMGFSIWNQGKLFIGGHGVAGELGHIPYGDEHLQCGCGNMGCLETNCSGTALRKWYDKQQANYPLEQLFDRAIQEKFIQNYLIKVAKAISTAVNLFDPHTLILGGGVIDMQKFPFEQLKILIRKHLRKPLPYNELEILKAKPSSINGAIGGAIYAINKEK
ncbi:allose kinase [Histophilus somni]|uniref:Allose kinase n=1 Tax=Histophilus somni TaxID=731 RepID=A0AAX2S0Z5_HISSO|nr:allose kinase [Histophilus somni]QEH08148.1 allose kinase [Histophilus somni]QEH13275.1 allose kinase [Histophilus somni]QEH24419.1 allose kinase [Histophilus somni]QEH27753.1 allose kinase [Histophilus somni]QEH51955.1 allose kinase [Histophilus somni]